MVNKVSGKRSAEVKQLQVGNNEITSVADIADTVVEVFYPLDVVSGGLCYGDVAGWVDGWMSHAGIVSKWLNLSENFFDRMKAPSF